MSGVRVSVTSSVSDPSFKNKAQPQNDAQNDQPKNNRVNGDDLNNPNFDEAITAIIDEHGGVHLNDGPGSLFSLVSSDHDQEHGDGVNSFGKPPINSEVKQNIRRGLTESQLILLNKTQLALLDSRANSRYQPSQRNFLQTASYSTQHDRAPLGHEIHNYTRRDNYTRIPEFRQTYTQNSRSNSRTPRQRIHIIINNRTQVQEIPIDDQIDFQRIPAIQQSPPQVNRYSNPRTNIDHTRRNLPVVTQSPPVTRQAQVTRQPQVRTTTPVPRQKETTERQRTQVVNDRRQLSLSGRPLPPPQPAYELEPQITSVRRETIPQRPSPMYRTPEPYSTAVACNQKACRLPDCFCAGSDIPGIYNSTILKGLIQFIFL